jgi:hypothetical protein
VSAFPLTGRSRLLIVHFNTRAYQTTSFAVVLTNAVKLTGSEELRAALCAQMFFILNQFSNNKQQYNLFLF